MKFLILAKMCRSFVIIMILISVGCKDSITPADLNQLNGYWKIDFITHKNETFNPKGPSKLLDFYEINDQNGIRKKVQPQFDNKFFVTVDQNNFKIIFVGSDCFIKFETLWDQWQERILKLNNDKLILEHQNNRYHYSRFAL